MHDTLTDGIVRDSTDAFFFTSVGEYTIKRVKEFSKSLKLCQHIQDAKCHRTEQMGIWERKSDAKGLVLGLSIEEGGQTCSYDWRGYALASGVCSFRIIQKSFRLWQKHSFLLKTWLQLEEKAY